jgi:uncharacterized protein YndB with AHSA1/START domain
MPDILLQRELPARPADAWAVVLPAMQANLELPSMTSGLRIATRDGAKGSVTKVEAPSRLRFTWQEPEWPSPSAVDLGIASRPNGSTLHIAHTELPDDAAAAWYQEFWEGELSRWNALLPSRRS